MRKTSRSNHQRCSVKKAVLKYFAIFTGKHLCWSLFLIKFQASPVLKNVCDRPLLSLAGGRVHLYQENIFPNQFISLLRIQLIALLIYLSQRSCGKVSKRVSKGRYTSSTSVQSACNSNCRSIFKLQTLIVELYYNSLKRNNDNKISIEINLLKTPMIVPYYLFPVTELRNVIH